MTHEHRTVLKQMGQQKELSAESKKEQHLFWCNAVLQTGGGATQ